MAHSSEGKVLTGDLPKPVSSPDSRCKDSSVNKLSLPQFLTFLVSHVETHVSQNHIRLGKLSFFANN